MKNRLTIFTKILLDIMFFGGIVTIFLVPLLYKLVMPYEPQIAEHYIVLCVILMICGMFAVLILWELRKMFATVIAEDCFVEANVLSLKRMGNYSFGIAITTLARLFCYLNSAVFVIIIVFVIAGLFSKVLAGVFNQAVTYKLENDLTI
ncbi:MAG: DUF2975 domain-containing protein [Lachnospiraceae bacterium]